MRTSELFLQKSSDFSKIMVCSHGQGGKGLKQCGIFVGMVGSIFRDFVPNSLTDGLKEVGCWCQSTTSRL